MNANSISNEKTDSESMELADFLEDAPPSSSRRITVLGTLMQVPRSNDVCWFVAPEIKLYCQGNECRGERRFRCNEKPNTRLPDDHPCFLFVHYRCSNCQKTSKTFALEVHRDKGRASGRCCKIGEIPPFGPPMPSRLASLIGPDLELFHRGRRSEQQGLGVGAFAYYRRIVENQKNRIIREMIKACKSVGADQRVVEDLECALAEAQFSKAVKMIKGALPDVLLIANQNPMLLLHDALSNGIHSQADDDCLQQARAIRLVMDELADRLHQVHKDKTELRNAVNKLVAHRSKAT